MAQHFDFERQVKRYTTDSHVQILFVFGILGVDNGDVLNPDDRGPLEFDASFEIFSSASQAWLYDFCHDVLKDDLVFRPQHFLCFHDIAKDLFTGSCALPNNVTMPPPCCENTFPLPVEDARKCYTDETVISTIYLSAGDQLLIGMPLFERTSLDVVAFTYQVETSFTFTAKYKESKDFYEHWVSFMTSQVSSAPSGTNGGWFTGAYGGEFFLFDIQDAMLRGTISGVVLAILIGFPVLLLTSQNLVISFYAITTIGLIIIVTVATLVLQGWELAVTESLIIILSIGLSIDFAIHLAVAYRMSPFPDRYMRCEDSIRTVGPAITMAAITTFLAGASSSLGRVISYFK